MEKIIGYIRYSSHAQDDGNSVAAQTTCIEQYATAHDMEIEKTWIQRKADDSQKIVRNTTA